jgi:enamine deaminase RidA (YjgF/YER057c/UK114 family)
MKLGRLAEQMAKEMDRKKRPVKKDKIDAREVRSTGKNHSQENRSYGSGIEDQIVAAIDHKNTILKIAAQLKRLEKTKDVQGFMQDIAPDMAARMAALALDPNESSKVQLEALKDMMDRAGYGKVIKHAVARVNASDSKEAIISHIMGAKKDLKSAGIEIVEEDEDNEETT